MLYLFVCLFFMSMSLHSFGLYFIVTAEEFVKVRELSVDFTKGDNILFRMLSEKKYMILSGPILKLSWTHSMLYVPTANEANVMQRSFYSFHR